VPGFIGQGYAHDGNERKGKCRLRFSVKIPEAGEYELRFAYTANPNRAKNAPVVIHHRDGESRQTVDQRKTPAIDKRFVSLGKFRWEAGDQRVLTLSNDNTDGHVVADAVQLIRQ
jgi:hypothetical protein